MSQLQPSQEQQLYGLLDAVNKQLAEARRVRNTYHRKMMWNNERTATNDVLELEAKRRSIEAQLDAL